MARLPYVDPEQASAEVRDVLARLPVQLNIFRMMAHAESNLRPLLSLGASILTAQKLDAHLRELAILQVARLSGAEYEWVQHVPIADAVGTRRDQIEALQRGDTSASCFDSREQLILACTTELMRDGAASAATFEALRGILSDREVVELIVAVGFYSMLARLMLSTAIDIDPPAGMRVVDAGRSRTDDQ